MNNITNSKNIVNLAYSQTATAPLVSNGAQHPRDVENDERIHAIFLRLITNKSIKTPAQLEAIKNQLNAMLDVEEETLLELYSAICFHEEADFIQIPSTSPVTNCPLSYHDSMISFVVTNDLQNSPHVTMQKATRSLLNRFVYDCWFELKQNAPEDLKVTLRQIEEVVLSDYSVNIHPIKSGEENFVLEENSNLLFQMLAEKCNTKAAFRNVIPVDLRSYIELPLQLQRDLDHALLVVWTDVILPEVKKAPKHLTADEIRAYLASPENQPALSEIIFLMLSNKGLKVIPPEIVYLANLQTVHLQKNQITAIPKELEKSSIQILDLTNNQITAIPKELANSNIISLRLSHNQITAIPKELEKSFIQILDLSNNPITDVPKEIKFRVRL